MYENATPRLEVISLFSGAGGLDLATERTGAIRTVARVEIQSEYCETIRRAEALGLLEHAPLFQEDVRTVSVADVAASAPASSAPRGVIGGPPCETFSTMGKRQGIEDPRGTLAMAFADFVVKIEADFFVLENVPQLEKAAGGAFFQDLLERFGDAGYRVSHRVLNAASYGAATRRQRLFVVGVRSASSFAFPLETHSAGGAAGNRWIGAGEALAGLPSPTIRPPGNPSGHFPVSHTPEVVKRFSGIRPGGYDNVRKRSRLALDVPSPSLVAGSISGTRTHIHPTEPRELTNRECARIQGFPDDFEFVGPHSAVAKQIANAVPIPLGVAIARSLVEHSW